MTTRITLIRHGETDWNVQGRWQGHAPIPLNDKGRSQAHRLAAHLTPIAHEISAVYSSDLPRARETAQIIIQDLGIGLPLQLDSRLRETDLGDWQGLTRDEVMNWDHDHWQAIHENPEQQRPGGESPSQVADRGAAALLDFVAQHHDGHLLVVSHGGIMWQILRRLKLIDADIANIDNTSATIIIHDQSGDPRWKLHAFNQIAHLDSPVSESQEG